MWGIQRGPVNSPRKWPVTRKMFPFDDVIMCRFYGSTRSQRCIKYLGPHVWNFTLKYIPQLVDAMLCSDLTHWGRVTHICVVKLIRIGSDNGLSPRRRQAIIWTNAGILLIWPLGTNFSENLIGIQTFSFKKMHLKMSSAKWRPFCLDLNVLTF